MKRSIRGRTAIGLALVAMFAAGIAVTPEHATAAPRRVDHFRCYPVRPDPVGFVPVTVYLDDQFTPATEPPVPAVVIAPERFCNPTEKRLGRRTTRITNPDAHLTFYSIQSFEPDPTRWVKYQNQFTKSWLEIGDALWLAVPTQKAPHKPPKGLDHFKCYEVIQGRPINKFVRLKDQWLTEPRVGVYDPVMFCNPTEKIHPDAAPGWDPVSDITNPKTHLVCYMTTKGPNGIPDATGALQPLKADISNQFEPAGHYALDGADVLCVPSTKLKWFEVDTDPLGSTAAGGTSV